MLLHTSDVTLIQMDEVQASSWVAHAANPVFLRSSYYHSTHRKPDPVNSHDEIIGALFRLALWSNGETTLVLMRSLKREKCLPR